MHCGIELTHTQQCLIIFPFSLLSSGNSIVQIKAQVMMRDDSTGGWVPMGGGGWSEVAVRKRKIHHTDDQPCKHEYLIHGKRISDQAVRKGRWLQSLVIGRGYGNIFCEFDAHSIVSRA